MQHPSAELLIYQTSIPRTNLTKQSNENSVLHVLSHYPNSYAIRLINEHYNKATAWYVRTYSIIPAKTRNFEKLKAVQIL